jgi:hypothetical protein
MIAAALLLVAAQPLPQANAGTPEARWLAPARAMPVRATKRLRDLRQAVQSLPEEHTSLAMGPPGPSGL